MFYSARHHPTSSILYHSIFFLFLFICIKQIENHEWIIAINVTLQNVSMHGWSSNSRIVDDLFGFYSLFFFQTPGNWGIRPTWIYNLTYWIDFAITYGISGSTEIWACFQCKYFMLWGQFQILKIYFQQLKWRNNANPFESSKMNNYVIWCHFRYFR